MYFCLWALVSQRINARKQMAGLKGMHIFNLNSYGQIALCSDPSHLHRAAPAPPAPAAGPAQPSSAFSIFANLIEGNDLSLRFSFAQLLRERSSVCSHRTAPSGTVRIQQGKVQGGLGARRLLGVRVEVDISELALGAWGTQRGHLWQRDRPEGSGGT